MQAPLNQLSLDHWYKVLVAACFVTFLLAGAGVLKVLPAVPTVLISLGGFWVGLGEWINHPKVTITLGISFDGTVSTAEGFPRRPRRLGNAFNALGGALVVAGLVVLTRDLLAA